MSANNSSVNQTFSPNYSNVHSILSGVKKYSYDIFKEAKLVSFKYLNNFKISVL